MNPNSGSVDAVTLPLAINDNSSTSSANAERGISNKSLPLPLNEPLNSVPLTIFVSISPVVVIEPLVKIEPVTITLSFIIVSLVG